MWKSLVMVLVITLVAWEASCAGEFLEELEEEMLKLVNWDREEHKLHSLSPDDTLREIARAHAQDMASQNFCGHESSDGRVLFDRIYSGGIWASAFAENVAKDTSVVTAEQALMSSPGHRKNLLDSLYTHIGIGVIQGDSGYIYITQNFIRKIEKVEEEKAEREIYESLNSKREKRGQRTLRLDPNLTILAWQNSSLMWAEEEVKLLAPGLKGEYRGVVYAYRTTELDHILSDRKLYTTEGSRIGIGLVQRDSPKYAKGMLWVTIIIAK